MGDSWSHKAWQPIIEAFINAWKVGGGIADMIPPGYDGTDQYAFGALWYRTILMDTECINDDGKITLSGSNPEQYWEKPPGFDSGLDDVNWAILMPKGTSGYTLNVYSGGSIILSGRTLVIGLNYGRTMAQFRSSM